jgi:hypothetical protein
MLCILINLGFETIASRLLFFEARPHAYSACVFRYFAHLGVGIWLSLYPDIFHRRNHFIFWAAPVSIAYLGWISISGHPLPFFRPEWQPHNFLAVFYPAVLILAGMKWLPSASANLFLRFIARCGIASYHIFLFQMLWFGFGGGAHSAKMFQTLFSPAGKMSVIVISLAFSLAVCLGGGLLWWYVEEALRKRSYRLSPSGFTLAR